MSFYIKIKALNGRQGFFELSEKLNIKGFEDRVEYYAGDWEDNDVYASWPHLKFEHEDDALAYILAYGGEIRNTVPRRIVLSG
mgnify:CR=1 FL=1